MEPELAKRINETIKDMFSKHDNLMQLIPHAKVARSLIERYPEFKGNIWQSNIYINYSGSAVHLELYNVESLKNDLIDLLDDLISLGYDPSKFTDSSDGTYRTFDCDKLQVYAYLKPNSAKCIKVLVESHVKMKEEKSELYKIVCLD